MSELQTLTREVRQMKRMLETLLAEKQEWKTARETGKTREQLRRIRETQPERVRVARPGARSYLYNL